jgi:hypothetical protein
VRRELVDDPVDEFPIGAKRDADEIEFLLIPLVIAYVGMRTFVPWDERQTFDSVESGERRTWTLAQARVRRGVTVEQMREGRERREP